MWKVKALIAPIAIVFLSIIITFGWFAILKLDTADNYITGLLFWVICIVCIVCSMLMMKKVELDFPFKVTIVMVNILYYIIFVSLVSFGAFVIPKMTFVFIQLILLFLYLVISIPIMLINVQKEGE